MYDQTLANILPRSINRLLLPVDYYGQYMLPGYVYSTKDSVLRRPLIEASPSRASCTIGGHGRTRVRGHLYNERIQTTINRIASVVISRWVGIDEEQTQQH